MADLTEINLASIIGRNIKKYRKIKKLTQRELGELVNKSDNTISNYEKGKITPSQDALFALSEVLDVSVDDLFPERESTNSIQDLKGSLDSLNADDIMHLKTLMAYIDSLDENERKKLFGNIELAVELFKKQN